MDLFERVSEDIKNAMKAKDKVALETLRNVKKFFLEAKTAPGANDTLTDADALKIMQKLVKQGKDSAAIYVQQGRQDLADVELAQVAVIEKYLPKQMSAEELEVELKAIHLKVKVGILSGHSGKQLLLYLKDDFDCRPEQKYLSYMEYSQRHLLHQDNQYVSAQCRWLRQTALS